MPAVVAIVGGGPAGLRTANLLARRLRPAEARIVLVDAAGRHVHRPGLLPVALGAAVEERSIVRETVDVAHGDVEVLIDLAIRVDPVAGRLHLRHGAPIPYDILVIATGAKVDRESIPGFEQGAEDFYSLPTARRLRARLEAWTGGRLVVGLAGTPTSAPTAPFEFALLAEEAFRRRGIRSGTDIVVLTPTARATSVDDLDPLVRDLLARRHIDLVTNAEVDEMRPGTVVTTTGMEITHDLAVFVPPHTGATVVRDSGLGDIDGWLPIERRTLRLKGFEAIYGQGDATDVGLLGAGSTAHLSSPAVAERIVSSIRGHEPHPDRGTFDGDGVLVFVTGRNRAAVVRYGYDRPVEITGPSVVGGLRASLRRRAYWRMMRRGRLGATWTN